ncbi:TPA: hypothetical protein ACH3X3_002627 [Trebouxia sp. C0006]
MLREHSMLQPAGNSRKSNKNKPCRRDGHDTRTEKSPERSSNFTDDRTSADDGPDSSDPDTSAKDMDTEQTVSPGRGITLNRRSTRLSALQPCQEKKRKHETHTQEKRKSRRNTAGSTEYKARQDLDERDADGTKIYNEYKRGELLIHGQDTYKKIKLDLKAMNEILNNTKESEHAPPDRVQV